MLNFCTLESFSFTDGTATLKGVLPRGGVVQTNYYDDKGNTVSDPKKAATSIRVEANKESIDVTLTFDKSGKKWKAAWIDAYRRK